MLIMCLESKSHERSMTATESLLAVPTKVRAGSTKAVLERNKDLDLAQELEQADKTHNTSRDSSIQEAWEMTTGSHRAAVSLSRQDLRGKQLFTLEIGMVTQRSKSSMMILQMASTSRSSGSRSTTVILRNTKQILSEHRRKKNQSLMRILIVLEKTLVLRTSTLFTTCLTIDLKA